MTCNLNCINAFLRYNITFNAHYAKLLYFIHVTKYFKELEVGIVLKIIEVLMYIKYTRINYHWILEYSNGKATVTTNYNFLEKLQNHTT